LGSKDPAWWLFGGVANSLGWILSDVVQLAFGALLICTSLLTARRTEGWSRYFWRLHALAFVLWSVAQAIAIRVEVIQSASGSVSSSTLWTENMLFCFWFMPLALALFLDPSDQRPGFDWLLGFDFCQGVLAYVAAYLYFFYLPRQESPTDLSGSVWAPYFAGYGLIVVAFAVRSRFCGSQRMRSLFGALALVMGASCAADAAYYYGHIPTRVGAWFDLLWSALLFSHLLLPRQYTSEPFPEETLDGEAQPPAHKFVGLQLFPLFLALCTLAMSARIAREKMGVASVVVVICFILFGLRHLVTHYRLLETQEALRREATHDGLTGLWRHKTILEILERELMRAQRTGDSVSVIMADLDHFKLVNDRLGHAAGDAVLRRVAVELESVVRPYDSVGRYGGEEFLIVAPVCGPEAASILAERARMRVEQMNIQLNGQPAPVTISMGIATKTSGDSEELLLLADQALYQAKEKGRNRAEVATGPFIRKADSRI
jgi:diguanylate cyclase (GGDEF)-like protein